MEGFLGPAVAYIATSIARATLLLLLAFAAAAALSRAAASVRHRLWAAVIVVSLFLPLVGWGLPRVNMPVLNPAQSRVLANVFSIQSSSIATETQLASLGAAPAGWRWGFVALGGTWLVGLLVVSRRVLRSRGQAARLLRSATAAPADVWTPIPGIDVRESDDIDLPVTMGALKPVIVLPRSGRTWEPAWRNAVIAHELAHVRRRDPLLQLVTEVVSAVYWFHPLAWLAVRQLRIERELAADDDVLLGGTSGAQYAQLLVTLACVPNTPPAQGAVVPLLTPSGLKARLLSALDRRRRRRVGRISGVALAALGMGVLVPVAAGEPVATAPSADISSTATCPPQGIGLPVRASSICGPRVSKDSRLILTITKDKRAFVGRMQIPFESIEAVLRNSENLARYRELYLHLDESLPMRDAGYVMKAAKLAGAQNLYLVTDPLEVDTRLVTFGKAREKFWLPRRPPPYPQDTTAKTPRDR